jgi:hypothetical protein
MAPSFVSMNLNTLNNTTGTYSSQKCDGDDLPGFPRQSTGLAKNRPVMMQAQD